MSSSGLLVLGAGGHGRVVADLATLLATYSRVAFLDDRYPALRESGRWEVIGTSHDLPMLAGRFRACLPAVGVGKVRLAMLDAARAAGFEIPTLVHPRAAVSPNAAFGAGVVVIGAAAVNIGSTLGDGCIVNTNATVDHDCRLGPGVHVCPGAHLAGGVQIGARTWFGIGAVARQGIRIGSDVTVAAGAVCVRDIADGKMVMGVPATEREQR